MSSTNLKIIFLIDILAYLLGHNILDIVIRHNFDKLGFCTLIQVSFILLIPLFLKIIKFHDNF